MLPSPEIDQLRPNPKRLRSAYLAETLSSSWLPQPTVSSRKRFLASLTDTTTSAGRVSASA